MSVDHLRHNWAVSCEVETAWETDVAESGSTLAESRRQVLTRPVRTLRATLQALDDHQATRLLFTMHRLVSQDHSFPLYPDVAEVTANSSGVTLNVVPTNLRYHVGAQLLVLPWDGGAYGDGQVRTIQAVGGATITLTGALTGTILAGSLVFPLLEVYQSLEGSVTFRTSNKPSLQASVQERMGTTSLPESHDHTAVGSFQSLGGVPILDIEPEWTSGPTMSLPRAGLVVRLGKESVTLPLPPRARWSQVQRYLTHDRAEHQRLLQFFDSRRGRLQAFWAVSASRFFTLQAVALGFVDVDDTFDPADFSGCVTSVAVVLHDGTIHIRAVSGIASPGAGTQRISLATNLPALTEEEIQRVGIAFLARFTSDVLLEEWLTNHVCRVELGMVEVLDEGDDDLAVPVDEEFECPAAPSLVERLAEVTESVLVIDETNDIMPPAAVQDGDILVLFQGRGGAIPTPPAGFTTIESWTTSTNDAGIVSWMEYDSGDPGPYDIGLFSAGAFMVALRNVDVGSPVVDSVLADEHANSYDVPLPPVVAELGSWSLRFATSNWADASPTDNGGLTNLAGKTVGFFSMHLWEDSGNPVGAGTLPEVLVDIETGATTPARGASATFRAA